MRYGPVPTGLRAYSSQDAASSTPRRDTISLPDAASRPSRVTSGVALTKRTVSASTTSTRSSPGHSRRATGEISSGSAFDPWPTMAENACGKVRPSTTGRVAPNIAAGLKRAATSSAVMVSPLWNTTPGRSETSTTRSSIRRHDAAKPGTCARSPR